MFQRTQFQLKRNALLVAAIAAVYPVSAYSAVAGKVDFASGGVTATGADGRARPLQKGVEIESGDLIQTGDGRAQLRFSDGGLISLQPNTQFRIDDYHYEGKTDGSEKGLFSLVKGGLRAITGAIGHVNKKNYTMTTPVATIGIRGTEFLALLNETLSMTCGEGVCVLFNKGGELVLYAGESGKALDEFTAPTSTDEKPNLRPSQKNDDRGGFLYSTSEDRDVNGNACSITGCAAAGEIMASGPGYFAKIISNNGFDGGSGSADFNGSNQLTQFSSFSHFELGPNAVTISSGGDGVIAWGRWLGNVVDGGEGPATFGPRDGFHYVIGVPTPVMPSSGTAAYTMIGATIPSSPVLGNGTFNGSLNVDFGTNALLASFTVAFDAGSATFANKLANISGHNFSGFGSGTGSLCSGSCSASFNGFFAGPDASRAGMAYDISGFLPNGGLSTSSSFFAIGTAAFARSGVGVPIQPSSSCGSTC